MAYTAPRSAIGRGTPPRTMRAAANGAQERAPPKYARARAAPARARLHARACTSALALPRARPPIPGARRTPSPADLAAMHSLVLAVALALQPTPPATSATLPGSARTPAY